MVKLLEAFLRYVPDHPVGMALLSGALFIVGDKSRGFEIMQRIKKLGFECRNYLNELAERLISADRIDAAILVLDAAGESGNATEEMLASLQNLKRQEP